MICESCGKSAVGYDLFDYCAECGKNLCPECMAKGHCGEVPAISGMDANDENDDEEEEEEPNLFDLPDSPDVKGDLDFHEWREMNG